MSNIFYTHERRCPASVEHKLVAGINESQKLAVTAQLQANMFLTAAHFMKVRLATHPSAAQSIESVTTYGVQVGIVCPIKILKLTLDFCQGSALFEELFSKDRCPLSHVVIDMAIGHLYSPLALGKHDPSSSTSSRLWSSLPPSEITTTLSL